MEHRGAFEILAMAASAGGLNALSHVVAALPGDFAVPLVVVQHLDPRHRSLMATILGRRTALKVLQAEHGWQIRGGTVYLAPPDHHRLVDANGVLTLTHTELVHFVRPSADLLFESAAASYRERAIAVVLSGSGSDGAMGVDAIKKTGGTVLVQDPRFSEHGGMPRAAQATGAVDFILPLDEIAPALRTLVSGTPAT